MNKNQLLCKVSYFLTSELATVSSSKMLWMLNIGNLCCSASLFLHQMIIFEDFYSRQMFSTFFHLPDLPKDRIFNESDIVFVFFFLRLINWAVHKSERYLFWRVKHKYLEWLIKLKFLPKDIENSRQVLIPDWVLLHCTHGPTLWHTLPGIQNKSKEGFSWLTKCIVLVSK